MIYKLGSKGQVVKQIQTALGIDADGIYGPWTEKAVMEFQAANGLEVDGIVGLHTWSALFHDDINITDGSINTHITYLKNRKPRYICLHFTAGTTSKYPAALSTRNVFLKRNASADFVVDDSSIVQINPDIDNYYCWAVGDKKNPYTNGGQYNGKVTNRNSISIEVCSNLNKEYSPKYANHAGWYFTEKELDNARKLVRYLMKQYNIPKSNILRHYDVTGKLCPGILCWNDGPIYDNNGKTIGKNNSLQWIAFKESI